MILSRIKPALGGHQPENHGKAIPTLESFLSNRDYTGAITLLEFEQSSGKGTQLTDQWLGYCAFHLGDYKKAMDIYSRLVQEPDRPEDASINLACCYFFLGLYEEAQKGLEQTPKSSLKRRLQFHLAHKLGYENQLMELHQQLENVTEDMLCLAALHYLRSSYHEAIDIYKKILLDNRVIKTHQNNDIEFVEALTQSTQYIALNVYVALCYYKLDYYDMSQEVLATYLQKFPDSAIALNLKACNYYKLENVKAAENEIMALLEKISPSFIFGQDIIKHNLVAFRDGVGALQVLPSLVDIISEARLNLTIYYLKQGDYMEAYELVKNLEPTVSHEYILKATVNAVIGQETNSRELIKAAQQYFQLVGNSVSECDTIPGRQCMASAFFFQRKFDDVHLYLSSIKSYFFKDDAFNFNYAQAKSALGNYKEAEETFSRLQNDKLQNDYVYITHMARCYIMQGKAQAAWELYLKMDTSTESLSLLQLIANDCYKKGEFYHAAKAFDLLERLDPTPEHWEGKRGACIGVFQLIVADKQPTNLLSDIIQLLRNSTNPQVESIIRVIKRWAKERKINI
ncbi:unnamed protein product [Nezara viridula]|uniref:Intraflagellar transport protein 56 n=1 Tax=Nezara viridula TaxID=85310 RepID=A0A9P0HGE0_NEZVI|nr:unnamed protein product [Nezara viridula]